MKVLVTGATGFLGTHLVRKLLEQGEKDIRCLIRQERKAAALVRMRNEYPDARLEFFQGDLLSKDEAQAMVKDADVIYHCAAALRGAPSEVFLNTVVASKNLLDALIGKNISRVVLISSFGVYGVAKLPRNSLINEKTPLEDSITNRDTYSYVKFKQEMLFWEYHRKHGIPLVVIRPGVIYGPGGAAISTRVGLNLFGLFLHIGNGNILPLTYVENCAEAIALAGKTQGIDGEVFNIHDDDLPTSRQFLGLYKKQVKSIRSIPVPYFMIYLLSILVQKYHAYSKGQLPDIFTPYKTAAYWKGNRFDNSKIKQVLGWQPAVSIKEGLRRTFIFLKDNNNKI